MADVLVVHPWKRILHNQYKEYFFMPERAVQICSFLDDEGYDVEFKDFCKTDLEDNVDSDVENPKGVRGTGETLTHYGISEEDTQEWLDENLSDYSHVIIDSLMPYFKQGVEQVWDACEETDGVEYMLYGEWVGLRPNDFKDVCAVSGNWELGCRRWLEDELDDSYHRLGFHELPMSKLPPPRWNEWADMGAYPEPNRADYRATRGCPEDCDFCHVFGNWDRKFNFKDASKVKEDIQYFVDEGFDKIQLRDDNFCTHAQLAKDTFEWIGEEHPNLEILQTEGMEMKTAANSPEVLEAIGEVNYHSVRVGFETAVEGQFNKNKIEWWETAYDKFKEVGFDPDEIITWVLAGHPKLSREDEIRTAMYLSQFGVRLIPSSYREVPGTELYNEGDPYIQGQKMPQEDDLVDETKKLYRNISKWNEWGVDLFRDDIPTAISNLSFIDAARVVGDNAILEGTVSGWERSEALEYGFHMYGVKKGQYGIKVKNNSNEKMSMEIMLSKDNFAQKVNEMLQEEGIVGDNMGGLL